MSTINVRARDTEPGFAAVEMQAIQIAIGADLTVVPGGTVTWQPDPADGITWQSDPQVVVIKQNQPADGITWTRNPDGTVNEGPHQPDVMLDIVTEIPAIELAVGDWLVWKDGSAMGVREADLDTIFEAFA